MKHYFQFSSRLKISANDFRLGGSGGKLAIFNLESTTLQLSKSVFRKHLARHFAKPMMVRPWFHFRFQAHNISMLYYEHPHSYSKFLDIDY
jgi:hypothetical protein